MNDNIKQNFEKDCLFKRILKCVFPFYKKEYDSDIIISFHKTNIFYEMNYECSICCNDFIINEKVVKLNCKHLYHLDCIIQWLHVKLTCPLCEKDVKGSYKNEILHKCLNIDL